MAERLCGGRPTAEPRQKNLYLLVDDSRRGYTIRQVDLSSGSGEDAVKRLPKASFRVAGTRGFPRYFTSAFGSRILVTHPDAASEVAFQDDVSYLAFLVIDVSSQAIMYGPRMNCPSHPIYIPVGSNKLFNLDIGSFELCCLPLERDGEFQLLGESEWSWTELQFQPFNVLYVTSYTVGNEEQTIFVSIKKDDKAATFTFDIGESVWKLHGEWALPFTGRGYFVRGLEGFVGLSKDPDTLGYIYSCYLASTTSGSNSLFPSPEWKRSKEKVFNKNPAETHLGATLVYKGQSDFCLVECVSIDGVRADQVLQESGGVRNMYRLITFTLKYDRMGDLTVENYQVHCYKVPRKATTEFLREDPAAFWL